MKLMIVDDFPLIVERVIAMMGGIACLTGVSVAQTLHEVEEKCRALSPDVVVLDVNLPDGNGLDAVPIVRSYCPAAKMFVFSNHPEYRHKAEAGGIDGFFDKSLEFEALVKRLKALNEGEFKGGAAV